MNLLLLIPILMAFFVTYLVMPAWIKKAKWVGLVGKDMNKFSKIEVAEGGGIVVIAGFVLAVLFYIALKTFYFNSNEVETQLFAILTSILILSFIGLIDSLFAASPKIPGWRKGLRRRYRILLCLFAAIPLIVINAGHSDITIPLIGHANIGWIYPLILIPIGIIGTSTTFNFLAGYNGLEASQGILILSALSMVAYFTGSGWLALIGLMMVFSLLAFFIFNRFPAKVYLSDVGTYPVGGMIAIMAILGNFERIALFFFIPYIIEFFLKLRGKLVKQSFGKPNKDNSLEMPYDKIYGLEHVAILILKKFKNKAYEKDVVLLINAFQLLIIILGFLIFKSYIF